MTLVYLQEAGPDTTVTSMGVIDDMMRLRSGRGITTVNSLWDTLKPVSNITKVDKQRSSWRENLCLADALIVARNAEASKVHDDHAKQPDCCVCEHALIESYRTCFECKCVQGQCVLCGCRASPESVEAGLMLIYDGDQSYETSFIREVGEVGGSGCQSGWKIPHIPHTLDPVHTVCLCGVRCVDGAAGSSVSDKT